MGCGDSVEGIGAGGYANSSGERGTLANCEGARNGVGGAYSKVKSAKSCSSD
jgi:hypothetical protein